MNDKLRDILGDKYIDHVAPADDYIVIYTSKDFAISFQEMKDLTVLTGSENLTIGAGFDEIAIIVSHLSFARTQGWNLRR